MNEAGPNTFEVETAPLHVATLDEDTRASIVKLPRPKVSKISKGTT